MVLPPTQKKRDCFHPGASALARESLGTFEGTKEITSKDMLHAMLSYIWPKVCIIKDNFRSNIL